MDGEYRTETPFRWLLVDFLTQERIGVIETRKKPRIKLSRFTKWLEKELGTLL